VGRARGGFDGDARPQRREPPGKLGGWALILALAGLVIGAAAWALGAHAQNYHQAFNGRRTVLVSGLAALLIGAAPAIVNFFFHAGQGVH
jgi:hypothetical protein